MTVAPILNQPHRGEVIPGIQYLRGLAAILVVVMHANAMMRYPEYFGRSPEHLVQTGLFGVAVFFVISGFVMAIVALDPQGAPKVSMSDFIRRRFVRIVPFMWLCIIGYNALTFAGTHRVEWAPFLRALVLWPIGELKPNVIWTLRHELLFYCLFAFTLLGGRRYPRLLAAWLVAPLVFAIAAPFLAGRLAYLAPPAAELLHVVVEGSANGAQLQFGAGMVLGLLWLRGKTFMAPRAPCGPLVVLLVVILATVLIEVATPRLGYPPARLLVWTLSASLVVWLGLIIHPSWGWPDQVGRLLGDASYAIYLVHNAALLLLLEVSARFKIGLPVHVFWLLFVVIAACAGVVVHKFVEVPLMRWTSNRLSSWRAQPAR